MLQQDLLLQGRYIGMRPTSTVSNESKVLMLNRTVSDILSQFNPCRRGHRAIGCILTDWDNSPLSNLLIHWRPLGGTGAVEGSFRLHNIIIIIIHTHTHTHAHTTMLRIHTLPRSQAYPRFYELQVWGFSCLLPDL